MLQTSLATWNRLSGRRCTLSRKKRPASIRIVPHTGSKGSPISAGWSRSGSNGQPRRVFTRARQRWLSRVGEWCWLRSPAGWVCGSKATVQFQLSSGLMRRIASTLIALRKSVRQRGVMGIAVRCSAEPVYRFQDWRFGGRFKVQTSGIIAIDNLDIEETGRRHAVQYQPVRLHAFTEFRWWTKV